MTIRMERPMNSACRTITRNLFCARCVTKTRKETGTKSEEFGPLAESDSLRFNIDIYKGGIYGN